MSLRRKNNAVPPPVDLGNLQRNAAQIVPRNEAEQAAVARCQVQFSFGLLSMLRLVSDPFDELVRRVLTVMMVLERVVERGAAVELARWILEEAEPLFMEDRLSVLRRIEQDFPQDGGWPWCWVRMRRDLARCNNPREDQVQVRDQDDCVLVALLMLRTVGKEWTCHLLNNMALLAALISASDDPDAVAHVRARSADLITALGGAEVIGPAE